MGLINKWFNKKQERQLEEVAKSAQDRKVETAKSEAEKTAGAASRSTEAKSGPAWRVLVRPLVTEKSAVGESERKYSFIVAVSATKGQVKRAVEELYGVKPLKVNVMNIEGRRVRFGRSFGRRSDYRKTIVTLPKGKSINLHSGV